MQICAPAVDGVRVSLKSGPVVTHAQGAFVPLAEQRTFSHTKETRKSLSFVADSRSFSRASSSAPRLAEPRACRAGAARRLLDLTGDSLAERRERSCARASHVANVAQTLNVRLPHDHGGAVVRRRLSWLLD